MKLIALLLAAVLAASMTGCEDEAAPEFSAEPVPTQTPILDSGDDFSDIIKNPVAGFYSRYYSGSEAMEELFQSRLEGELSAEAADTLIYLADHQLKVSEGRVTFAWLFSTADENTFTSSVSGAGNGSGSISLSTGEGNMASETDSGAAEALPIPEQADEPNEDSAGKEYDLYFVYAAGRTITGSLSENLLKYSSSDSAGGKWDIQVSNHDDSWESEVRYSDGIASRLSCDESGLSFTVSLDSADGADIIYQWVSDSVGARMQTI